MALGFGVVLVGIWDLGFGTGKAFWGQWEGWIPFIDHILSDAFILYFI